MAFFESSRAALDALFDASPARELFEVEAAAEAASADKNNLKKPKNATEAMPPSAPKLTGGIRQQEKLEQPSDLLTNVSISELPIQSAEAFPPVKPQPAQPLEIVPLCLSPAPIDAAAPSAGQAERRTQGSRPGVFASIAAYALARIDAIPADRRQRAAEVFRHELEKYGHTDISTASTDAVLLALSLILE